MMRYCTLGASARLTALAALALALGLPDGRRALAEAGVPDEMRRALAGNAAALSPITIRWDRTRSSTMTASALLAKVKWPSTAIDVLAPHNMYFVYQDGKFYSYISRHMPQLAKPGRDGKVDKDGPGVDQENSYDGVTYYNGNTSFGDVNMLALEPVEKLPRNMLMMECYYLSRAGFRMPESPEETLTRQPPKSLVLYLVDEKGARVTSVGRESVDGAETEVVDLIEPDKSRHRLYLDPALHYAVRRRLDFAPSGELDHRVEGSDYVRLPDTELWLPRRMTVDWHTWEGRPALHTKTPLMRETFRVIELGNPPFPESRFVVKYDKPGTFIADGTLPAAKDTPGKAVIYRVPAEPAHLDEVIKVASGEQTALRSGSPLLWRVVVTNAVAIPTVIAISFWYTRRQRAREVGRP